MIESERFAETYSFDLTMRIANGGDVDGHLNRTG